VVVPLQKPPEHGKGHRVGSGQGAVDGRVPVAALRRRDHSLGVRWYCRYGISYRELEEMMSERGVAVDHTTVYRWTQRYAPELEKRSAWYRSRLSFSWRVDETYVRVKGRCKYLYRAIDREGATLDFYLADRRNAKAAKRFLAKALWRSREWIPRVINTDKNPAYGEAIAELKKGGCCRKTPTGEVPILIGINAAIGAYTACRLKNVPDRVKTLVLMGAALMKQSIC
jgi:transposase-like protein